MTDSEEIHRLRERAATAIEQAHATLTERADRLTSDQEPAAVTGQDQGSRWPTVEVPERQHRAPPASRRYEPARARDWTAEQRWIEQIIDQRIAPTVAKLRKERDSGEAGFAELLGDEIGKLLREERATAEARLAASEATTLALIAELEREIQELRERAAPMPRMLPRVA